MKQTMEKLWYASSEKAALSGTFQAPPKAVKGDNGYIVLITFGSAEDRSIVTSGSDDNYTRAVHKAYEAYKEKERPLSLKLDVVTRIRPHNQKAAFTSDDARLTYRGGRDGIMIHQNPDMIFSPEEVQAYRLVRSRRLQAEGLAHACKYHPQITHADLFSAPADVHIVRTTSYYIDEFGYYSLTNGRRRFRPLTIEHLETAVNLTKDNYFKHAVNENGRITYAYYPHTDSEAEGYNILRHAGTVYSMLELYEWSRDKKILAAAERALHYLTTFARPHKINGVDVNVIVEEDVIKLGGNGLAVVACAKYTQVTGSREYVPFMQSLASWMEELQRDAPRLNVHKQQYSTGTIMDFESKYYPGEAILALVRLYEVDGDSRWLDYAEKEARYLIEVRDREADTSTISHDHWLLYGLYGLYRYRPLPLYRSHAFFIADAIVEAQMTDPDKVSSEMMGSYKIKADIPKSTPAACRSEGLGAAVRLAGLVKDHKRAKIYRRSIHYAAAFQLQMQLYPESVLYFPNKSLSLGAFRASLRGWELRNDYTQHNISSLLSYREIIDRMKEPEQTALGLVEKTRDNEKYPMRLRRSNRRVFNECIKRGAEWRLHDDGTFDLYRGSLLYTIEDGKVLDAMNTSLALKCVKRKEVTSALLRNRQLPAPENSLFQSGDLERAWAWAQPMLPIVVKPGGGSKGRAVSVDIMTYDRFKEAFFTVLDTDRDVLVEKYIEGDIYRFTCIGSKIAAIGRRRPLQVTGDGTSTIQALIEKKNEERRQRNILGHKEVTLTKEAEKTLRDGGWKIDDIPSEGEIVFIRRTSHVSAGGEAIDATDEISGAVKRIAVESIQAIPGLHMCGMDVIIDRDGQPHILEINNDPNITTHMEPWEGKSIPAASMIAEAMFPESI